MARPNIGPKDVDDLLRGLLAAAQKALETKVYEASKQIMADGPPVAIEYFL